MCQLGYKGYICEENRDLPCPHRSYSAPEETNIFFNHINNYIIIIFDNAIEE